MIAASNVDLILPRHRRAMLSKAARVFGAQLLLLFAAELIVTFVYSFVRTNGSLRADNLMEIVFTIAITTPFVLGIYSYLSISLRKKIPGITIIDRTTQGSEKESDLREAVRLQDSLGSERIGNLDRLLVMAEIDGRIRRLQKRTNVILLAIGCALIAAAFIVVFAGRLTSLDAAAVSNIDRLKVEIEAVRGRLNTHYSAQAWREALQEAKKNGVAAEVEKLEKQMPLLAKEYAGLGSPKAVATFIEAEEKRLARLGDLLLEDGWKRELNAERGYNDWKYIVATAITRIGVVVIIVYLVQILMGLYRYNTRMIAYYNSRRDMLTIWKGDAAVLKELDSVMAAPKVDFGREPKHPLEDILKAVSSKMQQVSARDGKAGA
jgi:hypothetical protein